jgi:hypothetical protein
MYSSSFKSSKEAFEVRYGSGIVEGKKAYETLTIAGISLQSIEVGLVSKEANPISTFNADGILGLGFAGLLRIGTRTLLDEMQLTASVRPVFAIFLTKEPYAQGSVLTFGGVNPAFLTENSTWHYAPVVNSLPYDSLSYWALHVTDFRVGETRMCKGRFCTAILDTGTSMLSIPSSIYNTFLDRVTRNNPSCVDSDDGRWRCTNYDLSQFPKLSLKISGTTFLLRPEVGRPSVYSFLFLKFLS